MEWYQNNNAALLSHESAASNAPNGGARLPPFHVIYQRYSRLVRATARNLGVGPGAVDDVVQETFVVVHARLDTLRNPEALQQWIYGIAWRRSARSYRRAQSARKLEHAPYEVGSEREANSPDPTPFEQIETNANLRVLARLLSQLERRKREVFALVELDELTVQEAANLLQIPFTTASSRLRRARRAFEAALARHEALSRGK